MASEEFSFTKWLGEGIEHLSPKRVIPCLFPEEFKTHIRAANREVLLACRSILDKAIARLEEPAPHKVTKIKVE